MLLQSFMFIFNNESAGELFTSLGMPTSIIIPLAIAKFLAVIAIVSGTSAMLKKLAYAGLAIDFVLAASSHFMAGDGGWPMPLIAFAILTGSYVYSNKLAAEN